MPVEDVTVEWPEALSPFVSVVHRQSYWDKGLGKLREALAHRFGDVRRPAGGVQATIGNGLSFDPFSFCQNIRGPPEVDVGGGEIIDALVVAAIVVVDDERRDLGFEIAGQEVIFQQDAVLEGLVPALDLALGHRMIGRAAEVFDIAGAEPLGEVTRDIAGTVVGQQPRSIGRLGLVQPAGLQRRVERGGDILGPHVGAHFHATM